MATAPEDDAPAAWLSSLPSSLRYLSGICDRGVFERGKGYQAAGLVVLRGIDGEGTVLAKVSGTRRYEVRLGQDEEGRDFRCDCPARYPCEHIIAVILDVLGHEGSLPSLGPSPAQRLRALLEGMGTQALVELGGGALADDHPATATPGAGPLRLGAPLLRIGDVDSTAPCRPGPMPSHQEVDEAFLALVSARWAWALSPGDEALSQERLRLEDALGPTLPLPCAAALLGVEDHALEGGIERGLPLVPTPSGQMEVPVATLLRLHEALRPYEGLWAREEALGWELERWQEDASELHLDLPEQACGGGRSHLVALTFHQAVAARLDEAMVAEAGHTLRRWQAVGLIDARHSGRWEAVLALPLDALRAAITAWGPGCEACDLRQNSPFAGALSEPVRLRAVGLAWQRAQVQDEAPEERASPAEKAPGADTRL